MTGAFVLFDYIDRYDWVILGGADGARQGAQFAASRGARVALVEPSPQDLPPMARERQMAKLGQLMGGGVDVVLEEWVWERSPAPQGLAGLWSKLWSSQPPWLVRTENRWLWGDRYLYAEALPPPIPAHFQQLGIPIYLPKDLNGYRVGEKGGQKNWAVLGGDGMAIAQCQQLAQRGNAVTLLLPERCLVDGLYEPIDRHLQNLLEIDGIDMVWNVSPSTLTAQQLPPQTDHILLGIPPVPLASSAGPSFAIQNGRAIANRHLQTTLPYLYLCGSALGGHTLPAIAEVEALTAIAHGLRKQWRGNAFPPIDYSTIPWTLPTNPSVTQWGHIGEINYNANYNANYNNANYNNANHQVAKIHCNDGGSLWVMWLQNWRSQSKIIGAAGIGQEAQQAIHTLSTLQNALGRSPTFTDILRCTSETWLKQLALSA